MTVTYEPARLNTTGSPHTLPLTHKKGSNADLGSAQAAPGRPVRGTG
jgi:hypothetical protein